MTMLSAKKTIVIILVLIAAVALVGGWVSLRHESVQQKNAASADYHGLSEDSIVVDLPTPHSTISSPYVVSGLARGSLFFEGSFPIRVLDSAGQVIGNAVATSTSDWMTTEKIPFSVTLTFHAPSGSTGSIMFLKDNESGIAANDRWVKVPVNFK